MALYVAAPPVAIARFGVGAGVLGDDPLAIGCLSDVLGGEKTIMLRSLHQLPKRDITLTCSSKKYALPRTHSMTGSTEDM